MSSSIPPITYLIERWVSASPNRNLQILAGKTGCSYNTLRRILIGQVSANLETTLNILNEIASTAEAAEFIAEHFPAASKFYKRMGDHNSSFAPYLKEELRDFTNFMVISLAYMRLGSRANVSRLVGQTGIFTADNLCSKAILKHDDVLGYVPTDAAQFVMSQDQETVLNIAAHILRMVKDKGEMPYVMLANVTKEAYDSLRIMVSQTVEDADRTLRSNPGNHVVAISLALTELGEYE